MRLHLPKALLAAVLAACLAWPAGAFTSTKTTYTSGGTSTTFNGDIWTWNNTQGNLSSGSASYTKYGTTSSYAGDTSITGPGKFYNYFFNERETSYLGNTLRFSSADADKTLTTDWSNYIWIGGIITESGDYTYKLGRDVTNKNSNFRLNGVSAVNMIINSSFTFLTNASCSVAVEKGGTWSVAKGKTLTFDTGTTTIAAGQTVNVSASGDGTENASLTFSGAVTNAGTINIGKGVNMTVSGGMTIDGALYNSGLFTNNGTSTINGSYTGTTITQTGDSATLTLASNSKVNMGSMTALFGTERDDNASGLQSYEASYTIADGGTITDNGAVFRVGGETFTGTLSGGVYTITESRYNILAGESMSIRDVENDIGDSTDSYYINVIGATTEGGADGTLTGVSDDTFTHGISGNGIIQVDTDTSLSYSKILDKAVEFTGSISVLGTLTGVVDSVLPHTIQGGGTVQVDENGTLSYAAFKKKASKFSGSINVVGLLSGVTDSSLTHAVTGAGAIQVDTGDALSCSKINEKTGSFTGSINVLGTLTGVSDSSLTHTITGDGFVQVDSGTSLSYTTLTGKGEAFSGGIRLDGGDFIINQNDAGISRPLLVTENSSLKLNGSSTWSGAITATANKVLSVSLADGATSGTLKLNGTTGKLSGAKLQIGNGVNVSVDVRSDGTAYIRGDITVNAGGTLTLNGKDALGYNGGQTLSITLAGSAPVEGSEPATAKYATLDLGTTEQTMQTALNLNGYAKITGTGNGSFNSWSNAASGDTDTFSKITVSGDHNEITCGVLVRQGLEVSVSENSSLEIRGTVSPKESGQSNAGFKKTGAGLLTITKNTTLNRQLQVQAGTMKISGTTNELSGAVAVSTGATLEFAGGSTTISSVVSGGGVIKVSGGTVTLNGDNAYTNETHLSGGEIQAGHANAFGTGKLTVDGTGSISGTATIADFIGLESGSELTIKENSAITLSNTGIYKGLWVKAGASVVLKNGASVTGYGVTVSHLNANSKLAAESGGEGQFGISGQLNEEKLTIKESAISLAGTAVLRNKLDGGTVSSTGNTTIGWLDENGTHGGGSISSLADTSVSDTLKVASDLAVTKSAAIAGTLNIGEKATTAINSAREDGTASSIAKLTGSGTLKTTGGETSVTNASGFSGTLEATGGTLAANGTTTVDSTPVTLSTLAGLKATGGSIELAAVAATLKITDLVVAGNGRISGATIYTADNVSIGKGAAGSLVGSLSINDSGTITLDASAGKAGTGLALSSPITTFSDEGSTSTTVSLTLGSGLTLNLLNLNVKQGDSLTLFSGVTSVKGLSDGNLAELTKGTLAAEDVFSGVGAGDFKLSYSNNIVALVAQRAVPEPTTATLSLLALMGLAARRRRRKA